MTVLANDAWPAFESRLRAYVGARVDAAWADDVASDIIVRLVQHRDELECAQNPLAWMYRVASNAITDHYRRRSTERRMLKGAAADLSTVPPADESSSDELAQCLIPMIRGLPPRYSEALLLTEIDGFTQAEAAERLGLSTSGVKSRVQRGRAKLKQAVLRCCEIELDGRGTVIDYRERSGGDACGPC